ncbi:lytic transglycosylase [Gordoniibacillus kamchatkensis]|uniref:Lytic transglycosylase n=1 Tax=Gordoniibacillus kamchatkensis TaxID=1590651 RepID=A0ABR5AKW9_9BACL|nr:lytic transglycosylase domain-containing protein [Paenibacillus sp. VKM B-2647]KIL41601.1 lytic transglycosylase [Paenibacillus sp. VKM B-2647]
MTLLRKKRVFALLLIVFVALLFANSSFLAKKLYPIRFEQEIRDSAANYDVDPFLIAAIIRVESNYQVGLQSKKGAIGVMQIMPDTAEWIVDAQGHPKHTLEELHLVDVNINLGSWYIGWLLKQYKGNQLYAVAAYNAGQGNVNKWKQNQVWDGTMERIERIPFGETRHYVQRVMYYWKKYHKLYGDEWGVSEG